MVRSQERAVGGAVPGRGHSLPAGLCQRPQSHGDPKAARFSGHRTSFTTTATTRSFSAVAVGQGDGLFNRTLCEKARLAPLDFDGVHDSIYHPFDLAGHRYMEYLHDYGAYADLPYDDLVAKFAEVYPRSQAGAGEALSGDFEAEIAAEAAEH